MNQLSNIVADFVRYRRAGGAARRSSAPDVGGRRAGLLTCRWRRDVVTGRLIAADAINAAAFRASAVIRARRRDSLCARG